MLALFSTLISIIQKPASKHYTHCAKRDFLHTQYAVYLHAIEAWHAVKCGIDAVMWCDVTANHRRAAHSIPHFTFRITHATVPHFTHSLQNAPVTCSKIMCWKLAKYGMLTDVDSLHLISQPVRHKNRKGRELRSYVTGCHNWISVILSVQLVWKVHGNC